MNQKIYEMIPQRVQYPQEIIQPERHHEERTVSTRLRDQTAAHFGGPEKFRQILKVFDMGISDNRVDVIILEGILKRIGIDKKDEENGDQDIFCKFDHWPSRGWHGQNWMFSTRSCL